MLRHRSRGPHTDPRALKEISLLLMLLFLVAPARSWAADSPAPRPSEAQIPSSSNLTPHFESVNGRQALFVEGRPFTVLAVEIPWWDLIYGRHAETMRAYDYLYPAARALGLNALKVPIKWSMVEPEKGVYEFTYVDHSKAMAEKHGLKLVLN